MDNKHILPKQINTMVSVLASSVVDQLVAEGAERKELISFAAEVLRAINDKGFPERETGGLEWETIRGQSLKIHELEGDKCELSDGRIVLRPVDISDCEILRNWCDDKAIQHSFSLSLLNRVITQLENDGLSWERHKVFVICQEQRDPVGLICLLKINSHVRQAETAKLLGGPNARGKGYAGAALRLLLSYAFDKLGLNRVYLRTAGFNLHNIKINEKIGFLFEGILRKSDFVHTELVDVVIMSILKKEYYLRYRVERNF